MKNLLAVVLVCVTVVFGVLVLAHAITLRYSRSNTITVTGLGKEDFGSDLIVWRARFTKKDIDLKTAYAGLNQDREAIRSFLQSKGIGEKEVVFSSIDIMKDFATVVDKNGNQTSNFTGYILTQSLQIESGAIDTIEGIARTITELINSGVEISSDPPEYYYTKLADVKIRMIASASKDARLRAETIAKNSKGRLGKIANATMGIFQITSRNSNEDYSWGGTYNTTSRMKTASITIKLQFELR
jgi:hypothetical protein